MEKFSSESGAALTGYTHMADSALKENAVLPDDDVGSFLAQAFPQSSGKLLAALRARR